MTEDPPDDENSPEDGEPADSEPPEGGETDDTPPPEEGGEEPTDSEPPEPADADPTETSEQSDSSALFGAPDEEDEDDDGDKGEAASTTRRKQPTVPTGTASGSADGSSSEPEQAAEATEGETQAPAGAVAVAESRSRVESALTEVRREGWKAAVVHAATEAAVVFFAANLVLVTVEPPWLPERVPVPEAVAEQIVDLVGGPAALAVPGSAALAAGLGVVAFLVGVGVRVRRPLVEQFEAANPPVREALRTARDAVGDDADSVMARRLYADVLDRLGESSGLALVDGRRVAVTVVLAVVLAVATVQVAVLDPGLFDPPVESDESGPGEPQNNYTGLLDGDQILGDSEAVEAGEEELNASIESSGGGQDVGEQQQFPSDGGPGTGAGGNGVDSQQAGFAAPEQVEDAELVREYNRRIRSGDGAGSGDGGDSSGSDGSDSNQDVDGDNT